MKKLLLAIITAAFLLAGCSKEKPQNRHVSKADLIEYNRKMVSRDSAVIVHYCKDQGLDTIPTSQGLWITVSEEGEGELIKHGDKVELDYRIYDITGKEYYTSEKDGRKQLSVGSAQDIMGLDIALQQLRLGSKATIIVMPDLAYGLMGDDNKIGARRILRYDIEVLKR